MSMTMIQQGAEKVNELYRATTYHAKHRHRIDWDATMHERGQLAWVVIYAAVFAVVIFECMTM